MDPMDRTAKLRLSEIRDRALGPEEARSRHPSINHYDVLEGGTKYERHHRANEPVSGAVRCYTNANSKQLCTGIVFLVASGKMESGEMDSHQILSRDTNMVSFIPSRPTTRR